MINNKGTFVFILPGVNRGHPNGGGNIIYQISTMLKKDGNLVYIVYMNSPSAYLYSKFRDDTLIRNSIVARILMKFRYNKKISGINILFFLKHIYNVLSIAFRKKGYDYSILTEIPEISLSRPSEVSLGADIFIFASSWQTAYFVNDYIQNVNRNAHGYYLIQNFEDDPHFSGHLSLYARNSYAFHNLSKIVINSQLIERFRTEEPKFLKIGVNEKLYFLKKPIELKNSLIVLFSLQSQAYKGAGFGLEAIRILKETNESCEIYAFGNIDRYQLNSYVHYFLKPTDDELSDLYNLSSVFVFPSIIEGMPAPPLEAMLCGNAVVVTDNPGAREYIVNGVNGIIVPPKDPSAIAKAVSILISNSTLRQRIANNGRKTAMSYSYDAMYTNFKEIIDHPNS